MIKDIGLDFVVYSQETFQKISGGFNPQQKEQIARALERVSQMHSNEFRVVTPKDVLRPTLTKFNENFFANPDVLNNCYNATMKNFISTRTDYSVCWLAELEEQYKKQLYVGDLEDDSTMRKMQGIIENGVGNYFTGGTNLPCDNCFATNFNQLMGSILKFLENEKRFETKLIQQTYETGHIGRENYEMKLL